jgi:hypothetical protein
VCHRRTEWFNREKGGECGREERRRDIIMDNGMGYRNAYILEGFEDPSVSHLKSYP